MSPAIKSFLDHHFRHFNAATLVDAARGYVEHLRGGGRMMVTLAGAMSTAELGRSLAEMIRRGHVHAICCTGANLEEDVYHLVASSRYRRVPDWRDLTPSDELELAGQGLSRVTDTCIPEEHAMNRISRRLLELWRRAERDGDRLFPHEYVYRLLDELPDELVEGDPADSWVLAAAQARLPLFVPGWEDSSSGNALVSELFLGNLESTGMVRSGLEAMAELAEWYARTTMHVPVRQLTAVPAGERAEAIPAAEAEATVGLFQIGGGIAGDFPICVVPMLLHDARRRCPLWGYFCQISDSTTSYGSYSGAVPNEKITWSKLGVDTPSYVIESDATVVAPLVFGYVLESLA